MITDKNFLGRNGFMWFTGVVEDRIDPEYLGRVKVRCIGFTQTTSYNYLRRFTVGTGRIACFISAISGLGFSPSRTLLKARGLRLL